MELHQGLCCGVRELHGLNRYRDPLEALKDLGKKMYGKFDYSNRWRDDLRTNSCWRYAVFSQAMEKHQDPGNRFYGHNFAALIRDNHLGELVETRFNINPNSRNRLKVWLWTVDHVAVKAFLKKHKIYPKPEDGLPPIQPIPMPNPLPRADARCINCGYAWRMHNNTICPGGNYNWSGRV